MARLNRLPDMQYDGSQLVLRAVQREQFVDSDFVQNHFQRQGAQTIQQQQQVDAGLSGIVPSPGAPAEQNPYVQGESMMDSAKHAMATAKQ